jgi:hypothetical protein
VAQEGVRKLRVLRGLAVANSVLLPSNATSGLVSADIRDLPHQSRKAVDEGVHRLYNQLEIEVARCHCGVNASRATASPWHGGHARCGMAVLPASQQAHQTLISKGKAN